MTTEEKVAKWYFSQFASVDGPDWEEVPQHTRDNCFKATSEIITLIDQQAEPVADDEWGEEPGIPVGMASKIQAQMREPEREPSEPVGWVSSYQLEQVASDPRILGVVTTLYKHKPEGTTFHVPLYLHPPASREREAWLVKMVRDHEAMEKLRDLGLWWEFRELLDNNDQEYWGQSLRGLVGHGISDPADAILGAEDE